jgi:hypothetical protein
MAPTSNPQHPVTLKVKSNHLDTTYFTIETPTTMDLRATHEATSLDVKATHKNSDISTSNTLAVTDLSATQGLAALEVNATHANKIRSSSNTSTETDLPPEVWTIVFEQLHTEGDYARPECVAKYAGSLNIYGDSIKAAKTLPEFEQRSWVKIRPLYTINRNSRAAALKLQLCLRVLQTSRKPVILSEYFPRPERLSIRVHWSVPAYVLVPVSESVPATAPANRSIVIAIPSRSEPLNGDWYSAFQLVTQDAGAKQHVDLIAARRVVLLVSHTGSQDAQVNSEWPGDFREMILQFWLRNGITDGTVEISM